MVKIEVHPVALDILEKKADEYGVKVSFTSRTTGTFSYKGAGGGFYYDGAYLAVNVTHVPSIFGHKIISEAEAEAKAAEKIREIVGG